MAALWPAWAGCGKAGNPAVGRHSRFSVDRHGRGEAIPFPDHRFDEVGPIRIVAQHHSDLANGCVDALIDINENGRAPKPVRDLFACNQFSTSLYQEEEQFHGLPFEAQNALAPLQPIPRLVKCVIPEMEYLGRTCPPTATGSWHPR